MTLKKLLKKLEKARVVCDGCGSTFGTPRADFSSWWLDTCDVCGSEEPVTEVRDYSYLKRGIDEVRKKV